MTTQRQEVLSISMEDEEEEKSSFHHYDLEPNYVSVDVVAYGPEVTGRPMVHLSLWGGALSAGVNVSPETARKVAESLLKCADRLESASSAQCQQEAA